MYGYNFFLDYAAIYFKIIGRPSEYLTFNTGITKTKKCWLYK